MNGKPKKRGVPLTSAEIDLIRQRMLDLGNEEISESQLARLASVKVEAVRRYRRGERVDGWERDCIREAEEKASKPWKNAVLAAVAGLSEDTVKRMLKGDPKDRNSIQAVAKAVGVEMRQLVHSSDLQVQAPVPNKHLSEFQALIAEKIRRFVGRDFVFKAIETFLDKNPSGYFTIVGEPGIGKSAILAKYLHENQCVGYFNVQAGGIRSADRFLKSVCTQLIDRYNLGYEALPPRTTSDGQFLAQLLQEASDTLVGEERLVVAIDALDEVDVNSQQAGSNILYLPRYLPEKVFFLLTRRPFTAEKSRLLVEAPHEIFDLNGETYSRENRADVRAYIRFCLGDAELGEDLQGWRERQTLTAEEFVEGVAGKSQYNFMYLYYVLPAIAQGFYGDLSLTRLPDGLKNYYWHHWDRKGMTGERQRQKVAVIYILVELGDPNSCETIAKIARQDEYDVQQLLQEWIEFLRKEEMAGQTCYSLYHASYRDFLHDKLTLEKTGVTLKEINKRIGDYLSRKMELKNDGE